MADIGASPVEEPPWKRARLADVPKEHLKEWYVAQVEQLGHDAGLAQTISEFFVKTPVATIEELDKEAVQVKCKACGVDEEVMKDLGSVLYGRIRSGKQQLAPASKPTQADTRLKMEEYLEQIGHDVSSQPISYTNKKLITGQVLQRAETKEKLLSGCEMLTKELGQHADKNNVPIMATTGIGGAGKTTLLDLLRHNIPGNSWSAAVLERISKIAPTISHLSVVMASMNQKSRITDKEQKFPAKAVINRFVADYKRGHFNPELTGQLPDEIDDMSKFVAWLRAQASNGTTTDGKNVAVLLLVDEVVRVTDVGARTKMLDELAQMQQLELSNGFLTMVVVTSLDVKTFHDFTKDSGRPVHSIPVGRFLDTPAMGEAGGLQECRVHLYKKARVEEKGSDVRGSIIANIEYALSATGGHPRLLEKVMAHDNWTHACLVTCPHLDQSTLPFLLAWHVRQAFNESDDFGGQTVAELAGSGVLMYDSIDMDAKQVAARLIPAALHTNMAAAGYEKEAALVSLILERALQTGEENLEKLWERAVPAAVELKARALLRQARAGGTDVPFEDVLPRARVTLKPNHRKLVMRDILDVALCAKAYSELHLKNASTSDQPRFVVSESRTEPGVEHFLDMFEAVNRQGTRVRVTLLWQMKMLRNVDESHLNKWIDKATKALEGIRCLQRKHCYIVMCVSQTFTSAPPQGVIYIDADSCSELLAAYGQSPMKGLIEQKAASSTG